MHCLVLIVDLRQKTTKINLSVTPANIIAKDQRMLIKHQHMVFSFLKKVGWWKNCDILKETLQTFGDY